MNRYFMAYKGAITVTDNQILDHQGRDLKLTGKIALIGEWLSASEARRLG